MSEKNYRIRFVRGSQEFEVEGDKEFVLDMVEKFEIFSEKYGVQPSTPKVHIIEKEKIPAQVLTKDVSVGEFIRQLNLKKHTDIVLAFGYYLEKYSGLNEFAPADINNCYYEAKLESSNTSQMIIQNIKRGFIMQSKGENKEKRYTLTQSGIEHIESKMK